MLEVYNIPSLIVTVITTLPNQSKSGKTFLSQIWQSKNNGQSIKNYIDEAINEIVLIREPIFRELSAKRLSEITKISEENILISLNNIIVCSIPNMGNKE